MINKKEHFQIMFVVVDQLYLDYKILHMMLEKYNNSNYTLASLICGKKVGNPTIFDSCHINQLMELIGDQGGRTIIEKQHEDCLFYQAGHTIELVDIDKVVDLKISNDDIEVVLNDEK